MNLRDTWVAQWLSICLWLRVWSQGPEIESHIRFSIGNLLLPLPMSLPFSLGLSWVKKNKEFKTHSVESKLIWLLRDFFKRFPQFISYSYCFKWFQNISLNISSRDTWVAQWVSICLPPMSWSRGLGIESPIRLPGGSLLLPLPVSLPLCVFHE